VLSALGVPHVVLSTSGDWLRAYAGFLGVAPVRFAQPIALVALVAVPLLLVLWLRTSGCAGVRRRASRTPHCSPISRHAVRAACAT